MHLSISEIRCYLQCPQLHYFRYVERIKKPQRASVTMGIVYDRVTQLFYQRMLNKEELPSSRELSEMILNEIAQLKDDTDWGEETPEKAAEKIMTAAELYQKEVEKIEPVTFQDRFEVAFDNREWTFLGYIDLIAKDGIVIDNKLLTRTPTQVDVDNDLQLTAYSFGYWHKYGELPKNLCLDCVILTKKPKFVRLETKRTHEDISRFLRQLGAWGDAIASGIVYPNPTGWWCSEKSCSYWQECRALWG